MNAERLLRLFERVADAPGAVARLRAFVLDLAVRGKLVSPELAVESSDILVASQARPVGGPVAAPPRPFRLPNGWVWTTVAAVCSKTGSGSTPRGGREVYRASGVPFLRSQNVHDDGPVLSGAAYIDAATHRRMSSTAVRPGDLLLNITGGSIGRCALVPKEFPEANVSQHVAILRVTRSGRAAYLHCLIRSPYFQGLILSGQTGAGRGGLPKNRMDLLPVALPPEGEQQRIVAKVDELMALCDELEAAQRQRDCARDRFASATLAGLDDRDSGSAGIGRARARFALGHLPALSATSRPIDRLRETILNLAVSGRLVYPVATDTPVSNGKDGVAALRKKGSPAVRETGPPPSLPSGWTSGDLGDWFQVVGGIQKTPARMPDSHPCPYLGVSNVQRGRLDLQNVKQFELRAGELERYGLEAGDLLIVEGNGSQAEEGRCAIWNGEIEHCVHQNHIIRCRPLQKDIGPFVLTYLNSPVGKAHLSSLAITSSGLYSLSVGKIRSVRIPLPPLGEQQRVVAKVTELMAVCDQLEASLREGHKVRSRLLDSLLAEALAPAEAAHA